MPGVRPEICTGDPPNRSQKHYGLWGGDKVRKLLQVKIIKLVTFKWRNDENEINSESAYDPTQVGPKLCQAKEG
jgi:hypothetical protein